MTPERIAEIKRRCEAATKGAMNIDHYDHGGGRFYLESNIGRLLIADFYEIGDREFYEHARADVPDLLAAVESLQADNARLRGALEVVISDWEYVTVKGAACEGCPDPEYIKACKAALEGKG